MLTTVPVALWAALALLPLCVYPQQALEKQYMMNNVEVYTNSQALKEPRKIYSVNGIFNIALHVKPYHFTSGIFNFTTRAYCYLGTCSVPGPTFYLKPGDFMNVTLVNELDDDGAYGVMNTLNSPNKTNMHLHGLRVPPWVDNAFLHVKGGYNHSYVYGYLPTDHAPGNHWYHSHNHGSATLQVMGGLVGAVILEPLNTTSYLPAKLRDKRRRTLVFTHVMLDSASSQNSDPFTVLSYVRLRKDTSDKMELRPEYRDPSLMDAWFVNGQYQPTFNMQPSEWVIFDMLAASGDRLLGVEVRTQVGYNKGALACDIRLLALDGVYLETARTGLAVTHLAMVQAQRATIALQCASAGVYYLQTTGNGSDSSSSNYFRWLGDLEVQSNQNLLFLNVTGAKSTKTSMLAGGESLGIARPSYLRNLRSDSISINNRWSMAVEQTGCCDDRAATYWMGIGQACNMYCFGRNDCEALYGVDDWSVTDFYPVTTGNCTYESFPGELGATSYRHRFNATIGETYELTIWGRGASAHPMHVHVNHFQISAYDSPDAQYYGAIGDWRDTWPATAGYSRALMVFDTWAGEYITHCHFMHHEDLGMMGSISVQLPKPSNKPTSRPSNPSVSPTVKPSTPSSAPTLRPTGPSPLPTKVPTKVPTRMPTKVPTRMPTKVPTRMPTRMPTKVPTRMPTKVPTRMPTKVPTGMPTEVPTGMPTKVPILESTSQPTGQPTGSSQQSHRPSAHPTFRLSFEPSTGSPTLSPASQTVTTATLTLMQTLFGATAGTTGGDDFNRAFAATVSTVLAESRSGAIVVDTVTVPALTRRRLSSSSGSSANVTYSIELTLERNPAFGSAADLMTGTSKAIGDAAEQEPSSSSSFLYILRLQGASVQGLANVTGISSPTTLASGSKTTARGAEIASTASPSVVLIAGCVVAAAVLLLGLLYVVWRRGGGCEAMQEGSGRSKLHVTLGDICARRRGKKSSLLASSSGPDRNSMVIGYNTDIDRLRMLGRSLETQQQSDAARATKRLPATIAGDVPAIEMLAKPAGLLVHMASAMKSSFRGLNSSFRESGTSTGHGGSDFDRWSQYEDATSPVGPSTFAGDLRSRVRAEEGSFSFTNPLHALGVAPRAPRVLPHNDRDVSSEFRSQFLDDEEDDGGVHVGTLSAADEPVEASAGPKAMVVRRKPQGRSLERTQAEDITNMNLPETAMGSRRKRHDGPKEIEL